METSHRSSRPRRPEAIRLAIEGPCRVQRRAKVERKMHDREVGADIHGCTSTLWAVAVVACSAGLTASSSLVLMKGISGLFDGFGVAPWTSDLLASAFGFLGAGSLFICGARRRFAGGLTPSQALAQLQDEIDLAAAVSA